MVELALLSDKHQPEGGRDEFAQGGSGSLSNAEIEAEAGTTTGKLLHFNLGNHNECTSSGSLAGCTSQSATVTNETTGGTLTENPATVHITIDTIYPVLDPDCPATHNEIHIPALTWDPDNERTMNHLTVASGTGTVTLGLKSVGGATVDVGIATFGGTVDVLPNGTWGILSSTI